MNANLLLLLERKPKVKDIHYYLNMFTDCYNRNKYI